MPSWWQLIRLSQDCYVREFERLHGVGSSAFRHSVAPCWRWIFRGKVIQLASATLWLTFATSCLGVSYHGHHHSGGAFPMLETLRADLASRATLIRELLGLE